MSKNKELGQEGEQLAANYLKNKGWSILKMNYRFSRSEIDLIASKNDLLIFVEVKTRTNTSYGLPEDFVDEQKAKNIMTDGSVTGRPAPIAAAIGSSIR